MDTIGKPSRRAVVSTALGALVTPGLSAGRQASGGDRDKRQEELNLMLRVLPKTRVPRTGRINAVDRTWEDWQKRTGELPPDFSAMPSQPFLPDPLSGIHNRAEWEKRRGEIRAQIEHWQSGRMPPAPDNLRAVVTSEDKQSGFTIRDVRLEFGPGHRGLLHLQLMIPSGSGPFPVFMTNQNRARPWTATAVARGYIGVIYFATDPIYGFPDDSDRLIELYPDYDFACLSRWAWSASRAVDYLHTMPQVDRRSIAITGHSRNGKQALLAAAFDERITAVIGSSGNTGAGNPWRYTTDPYVCESIEQITGNFPHWFHPRLRFFAGREDKLPFDQNSLLSLIAPRGLMLASSYNESQGNDFGFEQNYRSLHRVWEFLGEPGKLGLHLRAGEHPTTAGDIEVYLDFFDGVFGRKAFTSPRTFIFGYTFDDWKKSSGENAASGPSGDSLRWALGTEPPQVPYPTPLPKLNLVTDGWISILDKRPIKSPVMKAIGVPFGIDLKADLYLPHNESGKFPLVIWLHPYSYNTGYSRYARAPFEELVRRGYAVLAFDQIGFGTRVLYAKEFYRRYPKWSMLGKMIADTRAAMTAAAALDTIDASQIYLLGYSLGGKIALWTTALDSRPAAVISVAGVTPLRTSKDTEGIRHYSDLHGLLPRLGFYADRPSTLPFDYDDVLRRIGDRRVLLIAPKHDRYADLSALRQLVKPFSNVELKTPNGFNRFPARRQKSAFDWLDRQRQKT
ncbi:MAG TPA: alpha/beta fold hydrolase [Bryobacteraceae bacterium]